MATIVDVRLPVEGFPLGMAIPEDPGLGIELERIVPTTEGVLPFFWVRNCSSFERFERAVLATPAVRGVEVVSRVEGDRLYRARWDDRVEGIVTGLVETGATIVEAVGGEEGWRFELRFPERERVRAFQRYCRERKLPIEVRRVSTIRERAAGSGYQLTDAQLETVRLAYDRGYFEEPRGVTQSELATAFGVSQRAISRRLRRGLSRLVANTIAK
ncbi:helix-turn-helix domain-containing protein [Saliphagus infecundisoli]|uniref:Helix-turn-helix domain-containing protein n=1 Tax=Saliphagus infecundisoli TaxID=1849069 RepID=A0ABD5QD68_9EURY|nr:helix-turn-helix domain-containing protein [Saliphagus infecundisoli]